MDIDSIVLEILDSEKFKSIEYLISTIRISYLEYLTGFRATNFKAQPFIAPLVDSVDSLFTSQAISMDSLLEYMFTVFEENNRNGWFYYYYTTVINPSILLGGNSQQICCDRNVFMHIVTGFIIDYFGSPINLDINILAKHEIYSYPQNDYYLSVVNGVIFKRDYFIFDGKAYLYSLLTNTTEMNFADGMPAFARIITDQVKDGDILLRLDERLALPEEQAITFSKVNYEKYRGPQFHFKDSKFKEQKTIIVHISSKSQNKLLMVVKKDYDKIKEKDIFHVEIELLPFVEEGANSSHVITTFLHGIYYIEDDYFTHIDYARNQYSSDVYQKKYLDSKSNVPIDQYTESKLLHYKIWCIENGKYSREIWYQLMIASLNEEYQILLNEILDKNSPHS